MKKQALRCWLKRTSCIAMWTDAGVAAAPLQRQPHLLHRPWLVEMEWTEQVQREIQAPMVLMPTSTNPIQAVKR